MYCPHCGSKNRKGAQFCDSCGKSLAGAENGASGTRPSRGRIIVGAIVAFLLGSALSLTLNRCSGRNPFNSAGVPEPGGTGSEQIGSGSAVSSGSETTGSESSGAVTENKRAGGPDEPAQYDFVAECLDTHGYPTVYAICELKGWQLNTLLTQQGWTWQQQGEAGGWVSQDGTVFFVSDDDGAMDIEDINELGFAGSGEEVYFTLITPNYKQAGDVLQNYFNCVIEDSETMDDSYGVAVAYGPNMQRVFVQMDTTEEGSCRVEVYNAEAIREGLFRGGSYGYTIEDVFRSVAGKELGSH